MSNEVSENRVNASQRICDVVRPWAEQLPDHTALVDHTGSWTYRELTGVISETSAWLSDAGVRPGDRVMIVGENCRSFAALLLAVSSLDAWPVPVNAHLSGREIDAIRDHCEARLVIYTTGSSSHAAEHASHHAAVIEAKLNLGPIAIGAMNDKARPEPLDADIGNRVAVLIYTSGTTGLPKGVMLTHRNLLFAASGAAKIRSLTPDDRFYCALPLSHIVGVSTILLSALLSGATVHLVARFDPMAARAAMERERITIMLGVPSMFSQFLQYAKMRKLESLEFPALRIISCSGAPLLPGVKSAVDRLFGLSLHHGYGATECSPNVAQTRVEAPRTDISVGPPFPGMQVKLIGSDGRPVPTGEVGELRVCGPNVMKGYYRAPEETAAAIDAEGWFNTRDLAHLDDGNLFIVGRTKDLIIRFGFNVYPAEVEAVLNAHPAVAQSAVIGRSIEGDEEVIAFVQPLSDSSVTKFELADYASQHLADYKRPSHIVLLAEMPVTPLGKIMKTKLTGLATDLPRRGASGIGRLKTESQSVSDRLPQDSSLVPSQSFPVK